MKLTNHSNKIVFTMETRFFLCKHTVGVSFFHITNIIPYHTNIISYYKFNAKLLHCLNHASMKIFLFVILNINLSFQLPKTSKLEIYNSYSTGKCDGFSPDILNKPSVYNCGQMGKYATKFKLP